MHGGYVIFGVNAGYQTFIAAFWVFPLLGQLFRFFPFSCWKFTERLYVC